VLTLSHLNTEEFGLIDKRVAKTWLCFSKSILWNLRDILGLRESCIVISVIFSRISMYSVLVFWMPVMVKMMVAIL